jgi:hypothetical protein
MYSAISAIEALMPLPGRVLIGRIGTRRRASSIAACGMAQSGCWAGMSSREVKRRLSVTSPVLRGHPSCPYYNESGELIGRLPAMIAPISGLDGALLSVQRTYLADVEPRKKVLSPIGKDAAVRLFEPTAELAVIEGIETALAVNQMRLVPVWVRYPPTASSILSRRRVWRSCMFLVTTMPILWAE